MAITAADLKKLSPQVKAALLIIGCLLIAYLYYYLYLQAALEKKSVLESNLTSLVADVDAKQKIAAEKDKYVQELKELRKSYHLALTKLPDKREIPGLFESVSLAGRNSGIDFLLFEPIVVSTPADEANKNQEAATGENAPDAEKFYSDIPINVKVIGSFQNTLEFFDKVAKLPRIINIENLALGERKVSKGKDSEISTTCTIKTYMFLDKEKINEKESNNAHAN